jgi:hypothetical protein
MKQDMVKIKPNLQFSVLCDDVRREDNGKFMLLGLFEAINARKFPATHAVLFVANRWCKGEGEFIQKIRIVNSKDGKVVFQTDEQPFKLADIDAHHTLISRFVNLVFPNAGKYWVEVLLDNELFLNYPVMLVQKVLPQEEPNNE